MEDTILSLIKLSANIPRNLIKLIKIEKDGNCFYWTLCVFFMGYKNEYEKIRQLIYEGAKNNKKVFIPFFLPIRPEEGLDDFIVSRKFDNYIKK